MAPASGDRRAGSGEPPDGGTAGGGQTDTAKWEYLGVGCFSAFVGFAGGGMISVLIAKIVGAFARCTPEAETGAPCNWFTYAVFGAAIGLVVVPLVSLWLFRRGRVRANYDRG
jgi:F0F1-type ATP synthase membrane subunit c/vacuolar-type H+-ATPase subunit K